MVGHDDAISADVGSGARVLGIEYSLDDERSLPARADPIQVLPDDRGVKIGAEPTHVVIQATRLTQHGLQVAEPVRTAVQPHVPGPTGLAQGLQYSAQGGSWA